MTRCLSRIEGFMHKFGYRFTLLFQSARFRPFNPHERGMRVHSIYVRCGSAGSAQ